jgi:branched chain amino acid efflux pump
VGAASAAPTCFALCSVEAMQTSRLRDGVRAGLPLALAPLLFGASFGLLAVDAGMGWAGAIAMSATTFAGSAQFAAASILEDGGGVLAAIVAAILLNARYVPLSLAVASIFPGSRRRRFLESQLIVDESWALSGRSGRFDYAILAGVGILLYVLWVGGTAVGTVVGDLLDPEAIGLDAAFPALFLALLAPYLRTRRALVTALVAGGITFVLLPFAPPGVPIVAASLACLIGLRR